ncbi:MAG: hypothetical protein LBG60_07425 [Bifidobacteriaceae bacterium]|nr:hypothetical protein [Bifidobacteriaceae bacterium]
MYVSTCALARLSWWMGEEGLGAGDVSHVVLDAYVAAERARSRGVPGAVGRCRGSGCSWQMRVWCHRGRGCPG